MRRKSGPPEMTIAFCAGIAASGCSKAGRTSISRDRRHTLIQRTSRPSALLCAARAAITEPSHFFLRGYQALKPTRELFVLFANCAREARAELNEELPGILHLRFPVRGIHAQ